MKGNEVEIHEIDVPSQTLFFTVPPRVSTEGFESSVLFRCNLRISVTQMIAI